MSPSFATPALKTCWRSCPDSRSAFHRRFHRGRPHGLRPEQPFPREGGDHGSRRASCPMLPRRRCKLLRLRAWLHRPRDVARRLTGLLAHRPVGVHISAPRQPLTLPGVQERWEFIEPTLKKTPVLKMVPMVGSLGCPYTCSFCIDANVPYQPMDFDAAPGGSEIPAEAVPTAAGGVARP